MGESGGVWTALARQEMAVVLASLVALWCERRGRLVAARTILVATVVAETHLTVALEGFVSGVTVVFPVVVFGIGLLLGGRAAAAMGALHVVSLPLALLLGGRYRIEAALHADRVVDSAEWRDGGRPRVRPTVRRPSARGTP